LVSSLQDIRVTLPFGIKDISLALDDIQVFQGFSRYFRFFKVSQCLKVTLQTSAPRGGSRMHRPGRQPMFFL
jgi:hypothetical protein